MLIRHSADTSVNAHI